MMERDGEFLFKKCKKKTKQDAHRFLAVAVIDRVAFERRVRCNSMRPKRIDWPFHSLASS